MKQRIRSGFTLVELLIVIIIGAVLASIAIPKFNTAWRSSSESRLRENLKEYRNAIERYHSDTGFYPATMSDIRAQSAPANALDANGVSRQIPDGTWNGPYLKFYPSTNAIYPDLRAIGYSYGIASPTVGKLFINSSNRDLNGARYNTW